MPRHKAGALPCRGSAFGDDLAVYLFLVVLVSLDDEDYAVANLERSIVVMEGVVAHDGYIVRKIAEDAAAVLPGDHRLPVRVHRMSELRSVVGVWRSFLDRDDKLIVRRIVTLNDARQSIARMVHIAQVRDRSIG